MEKRRRSVYMGGSRLNFPDDLHLQEGRAQVAEPLLMQVIDTGGV